jgi:hypothetical protein
MFAFELKNNYRRRAMKKTLTFVCLVIFATACSTPTENTNHSATTNTNTATKSAPAPVTEADAIAKEKAAWEAFKAKDTGFTNMLTSDAITVVPEAVYDRDATAQMMRDYELTEYSLSDWKFLSIDNDLFVVVYTANSKGKMNGKDMPPQTARCSSAWVNRDGKWVSFYHQECPVKQPPPPPPPPKAGASPSPASTPAPIATGPDAEANEKAIWEAFKAKNFDGVAAALAPESLEVEPDGVFTKETSIKMLKQFDFSKATLSDFKTVRIDSDATLVTYLAKIPGAPGVSPNGERHSTIWANRSGKWLAVFHHGTPAVPAPPPPKGAASPSPKAAASPSPKAPAK